MSITEVKSQTASLQDFGKETLTSAEKDSLTETFSQLVREKEEEFYEKRKTGTTEPSYPIGAGSYTEKEWEKLIKCFDAAEDALRKAAGLEEGRKTKKADKEKEETLPKEADIDLLFVESTSCTYPSSDPEQEDTTYITFYSTDGIYCRKEGENGYEWGIDLKDEAQYEKIMAFLNNLDSMENLWFACHENFWQDFLEDRIDMDGFYHFLDTKVVNGVPDYIVETQNGQDIDPEAAQYAPYMNKPGLFHILTEEEIEAIINPEGQGAVFDEHFLDGFAEWYYREHPDEMGKRNMIYKGSAYTISELVKIWQKEFSEKKKESSHGYNEN